MGRKIKEIAVVIMIMLAASAFGGVLASKSLADDVVQKTEDTSETDDKEKTGGGEPEQPEGPGEPEEPGKPEGPGEPEEPDKPVEKYEFRCPAPDGKNGYYVTLPEIEITHVSEYGVTKFRFTDSEGNTVQGELSKSGDRMCIQPEQFKEGGNSIYIWMEDEEGIKVEDMECSKELLVDTSAPQIQLLAPQGLDAWYQKQVMLSVRCKDGGKGSQVEQISVHAGEQMIGTTPNAQGAFLISRESAHGKGVPITVTAIDKAGNKNVVGERLYIDNAIPETAIQGIDNYMITSRPTEVCFRAQDDNILRSAAVKNVRETPEGDVHELAENKWESDGEARMMRQQLDEDGIYKMELSASDKAGFVRSQSAQIIIDKKNPVIRFVDELDGQVMREFQWDYTPGEAIKDFTSYIYEIRLDGKLYPPGEKVKSEGVHIFTVKAVDAAGNKAEARAQFTIDRTLPEIIFTDVEEGRVYEEECTFRVTLKDSNDTIEGIWIDGEKQAVNPRSKTYEYTVQELGEHVVLVKACDKAGNVVEADLGFEITEKETIFEKIINPVKKRLMPEKEKSREARKTESGAARSWPAIILSVVLFGTVAGIVVYRKTKK